ncbi:MAG: hypothetical protein ACRCYV_05015 [Aeromonas sp.]
MFDTTAALCPLQRAAERRYDPNAARAAKNTARKRLHFSLAIFSPVITIAANFIASSPSPRMTRNGYCR